MRRYVINVCPEHGGACVDHDHDPVPLSVVPTGAVVEMGTRLLNGDDRGEAQLVHLARKEDLYASFEMLGKLAAMPSERPDTERAA